MVSNPPEVRTLESEAFCIVRQINRDGKSHRIEGLAILLERMLPATPAGWELWRVWFRRDNEESLRWVHPNDLAPAPSLAGPDTSRRWREDEAHAEPIPH